MSAYTDVPGAASAAAGGGAIPSGIPMPSSSEPLQAPAAAAAAADSSSSSSSVGATYGDEGTHGQEKQQERFARQKLEQQQQQQARRLQGEADIAAADETPSSTHTAAATGAAVATPVSMNEKASTADVVVAKPALQQQEPRRSGWTAAFGGGSKKKTTNNRLEKKHHRSNSSSAADEASAASSTSSSSIVGADDEKRLAGAGATKKERRRGRGKAVIDAKHPVKEKDQHPPIGLLAMFRYATWFEAVLNIVGLVLAAGAGATQPLMTLIFGRLTTSFTGFGSIILQIQADPGNPALLAQLAAAREQLKHDSSLNALYLVIIGIGMGFCTYFYMLIWTWTSEVISSRVRERYLRAVLHSELAYFDVLSPGEVATRIENDALVYQTGISEKQPLAVSYLATFATGFILAYVQSWRLALALTSILPVIMACGAVMGITLTKFSKRALDSVAKAGSIAEEAFSSIRTVQAFNSQGALAGLFGKHIDSAVASGLRTAWAGAFGLGSMFFTIYSAYALAFFFGGILITQGHATSGQVVSAFLSVLIGSFSLAMLNPELEAINKGRGSAAKLFATIERVPNINSADEGGLRPAKVEGTITFEGVTFAYPSRQITVLQDFTQTFESGQQTALVGASGSGKSTIVSLISRLYDPAQGRVLLDGIDIRELNIKWLRAQCGVVGQEPVLFEMSILNNIRLGLIGTPYEHAPMEEQRRLCIEAAKTANAHDFISSFDLGYDQSAGTRGSLLSGGQKSRVAIARAIVSNPVILLLDEATAALDAESERVVTDALEKASRGRTTITVAHRLSTIAGADKILVMGGGRLLESGDHHSLTSNPDSAYSKLVTAQQMIAEKEREDADQYDEEGTTMERKLSRTQTGTSGKPEMPGLDRKATGRSLASEILAEQKAEHDDDDDDNNSKHGMIWLARRCYALNREQKWLYVGGFIASILSGAVYPVMAIVFGKAINTFSDLDPEQLKAGSRRNALWYFIIAILAAAFIVVQQLTLIRSAETLVGKIRKLYFKSMLRQDISFFDDERNASGTLTSNLSKHPQNISGIAGVTLGTIIQSCATVLIGVIIGLSFGAKLAAIGIACIPLLVSAGFIRLKVVVQAQEKTRKMHSSSAQKATEAVAAIKTVMYLCKEHDTLETYHNELQGPLKQAKRTAFTSTLLYAASQAMSFFVIALVFWVGSRWLADQTISTSSFFTVLNSIVFASIQAGNVFNFVPDVSRARSAGNAIFRSLDAVPVIDAESTEGKQLDVAAVQGDIVLDSVHFRYPTRPKIPVLRGLSLRIPAGKYVAIVGPSGSGKSTTIQLISRFYDPLSGAVSLDGQNVADYQVASYRRSMALVAQEPTLYSGTIEFNIKLGATKAPEEVTREEVEAACRQANILEFIESLPDGFATECGNKSSVQLSGGQKQRIALARALVSNPKILLLDEATSALDSTSERAVQAALDQATMAAGRTTISIAHRLSSIQRADIIYYVDRGVIQEFGDHQALMRKRGKYYELVQLQTLSGM